MFCTNIYLLQMFIYYFVFLEISKKTIFYKTFLKKQDYIKLLFIYF